jgi:hypothetical protein
MIFKSLFFIMNYFIISYLISFSLLMIIFPVISSFMIYKMNHSLLIIINFNNYSYLYFNLNFLINYNANIVTIIIIYHTYFK